MRIDIVIQIIQIQIEFFKILSVLILIEFKTMLSLPSARVEATWHVPGDVPVSSTSRSTVHYTVHHRFTHSVLEILYRTDQ